MSNTDVVVRDVNTLQREAICIQYHELLAYGLIAAAIYALILIISFKLCFKPTRQPHAPVRQTRDVASFTDRGSHLELRRLRFFMSFRASQGHRVEIVRQCLHSEM